jgi:beta-lactam-binding protein with PASTA domain
VTTPADINLTASGIRIERHRADNDEDVAVPDLIGKEWSAARLVLERAGLIAASTNADGTVKSQIPAAGAAVPQGSKVTVHMKGSDKKRTIEHQVTLSTIKALRDDSNSRDASETFLTRSRTPSTATLHTSSSRSRSPRPPRPRTGLSPGQKRPDSTLR